MNLNSESEHHDFGDQGFQGNALNQFSTKLMTLTYPKRRFMNLFGKISPLCGRAASSAMFSRKIKAQLVVWVEQIPRIHGRRSDSDSPFPANGGILIGTLHSVHRFELI